MFQYCAICFLLETSVIEIIEHFIISLILEIVFYEFILLLLVTVEFPHDFRIKYWEPVCL